MSRATWYRHGKPTEKPKKLLSAAERVKMFLGLSVSTRTAQRIERVLAADVDLAAAMLRNGWCKPAQAEAIIKNPVLLRKFRRMAKRAKRERD